MSRKTRKLIWSVPLMAAIAVIGALAVFMALQPNQTEAQGVPAPGQPQNFKVSAESETIIKLEWDAPTSSTTVGRQTRYRIDHSSDGKTWELLSDAVSGQDDEYRHSGLDARQTVYYRMFALNSGGTQISTVAMSDPASTATMASTKPAAPERVSSNPGDADDVETPLAEQDTERTQITIRWAPPMTPDGTTIHQYKVAYAQNPSDLGLGQARTLDVVSIPTDEDDEVYCGYSGTSGSVAEVGCRYTFTKLLEHQIWHYEVYALNEDALGVVGTSNPSDTTSTTTKDSVLPNFQKGTVTDLMSLGGEEQVHANPFAAVKKGSPGIFLSWTAPKDPDGAPVTDYIVHARPVTDIDGEPTADPMILAQIAVAWGSGTDNAVIFHDGETTDLLLTDAKAELQRAARVAWNADARLQPATLRDLASVDPFEEYFSNLEWQVRVIAVNRVWSREVQRVPQAYDKALQHGTIVSGDFVGTTTPAGVLSGLDDENLESDTLINASPAIRVSLNELDESEVGEIAPASVELQNPVDSRTFTAVRHDNTNGGRTRIDLTWTRTNNGAEMPATTDFAQEYRIQYSTDRKTWTPLDSDGDTNGHQDFLPADADCNNEVDDTADTNCTVSHTDLTAGTTYYYRLFAANTPDGEVNDDTGTDGQANDLHTVFSTSVDANATTIQAKKPGRPTDLTATNSNEDGHTMIDLEWAMPMLDADGEGEGDGYGTIVAYILAMSNDGGATWTEKRITAKAAGTPPKYTHEDLKPGETWRYQVRTVNEGPAEKMSDWSDTATLATVKSFDPDKPESLVAESMGTTAIKLCWNIQSRTPPAAPIDAYLIEYQDGDVWTLLATVTDDNDDGRPSTYYVDTTLSPDQTRTYRVVAQNEPEVGKKARSPESDSVSATTEDAMAPDAPTGVTATADSDTAITVSWTAPADPDGAPVTGYKVMWKMSSATDYADADMAEVMADATMHQVTGLTASTEYTFKVMAKNAKGYGAAAEAMETTDPSNRAPVDGPDLTAAVTAGETVMVQSTISDPDGASDLTWNTMTSSTAATIATATVNATTGMVTITGVAAGMATITVTAMDMAGESAKQMIMVTVEAADTTLGVPGGVMTSDATDDPGTLLVKVDWTPGNNAIGHLVMLFTDDWQGAPMVEGTPTGNSHTFTVDAGSYIAVVVAYDAAGNIQLAISGVTSVSGS